jgi:hypothetical protein
MSTVFDRENKKKNQEKIPSEKPIFFPEKTPI